MGAAAAGLPAAGAVASLPAAGFGDAGAVLAGAAIDLGMGDENMPVYGLEAGLVGDTAGVAGLLTAGFAACGASSASAAGDSGPFIFAATCSGVINSTPAGGDPAVGVLRVVGWSLAVAAMGLAVPVFGLWVTGTRELPGISASLTVSTRGARGLGVLATGAGFDVDALFSFATAALAALTASAP